LFRNFTEIGFPECCAHCGFDGRNYRVEIALFSFRKLSNNTALNNPESCIQWDSTELIEQYINFSPTLASKLFCSATRLSVGKKRNAITLLTHRDIKAQQMALRKIPRTKNEFL